MAAKRGMNERIQKLKSWCYHTGTYRSGKRAKIETDFYKENDRKYSIPVC